MLSPSSQTSVPTLSPSPQIGIHVEGLTESQIHPFSTTHEELHPSKSTKFPSSQGSVPKTRPSPHSGTQFHGVVDDPPVQIHPVTGIEQSPSHLSAEEISPSSQNSPIIFLPSPQIGEHNDGIGVLTHK